MGYWRDFSMSCTPQNADDEYLLKPWQVEEILGVSRPTLYRLLKKGEIVCVKIGKCTRFRRSDLNSYMAGLETSGEIKARKEATAAPMAYLEEDWSDIAVDMVEYRDTFSLQFSSIKEAIDYFSDDPDGFDEWLLQLAYEAGRV
jgi:excisionase family DNA binding protein